MRTLVLPLALGLSLVTGCSVAVTAKTQTRYTTDIPARTSTKDWSPTQTITIDDASVSFQGNGSGLTVTGDPTATKVTVTGRAVAYADDTDKASADLSITDVLATVVITETADGITVSCGHGSSHGSSSGGNSGCEALQVTVPSGTDAKPLNLVVKAGSGDVKVSGTVGWLNANDNGAGDITASHTPTKGSVINIKGGFAVTLAVPSNFAADTISLTADVPADVDTTAFPDVTNGKGRGTAGTGAASITLTSDGPPNTKVILKSQ
jgi:hypothetical protein